MVPVSTVSESVLFYLVYEVEPTDRDHLVFLKIFFNSMMSGLKLNRLVANVKTQFTDRKVY